MQIDSETISAVQALSSRYSRKYRVDWEDLQQEVYVALLELEGEVENVGGLVRTIVRRTATNLVRSKVRQRNEAVSLDAFDPHDEANDWMHPKVDGGFSEAEDRADIARLLTSLPDHERAVVALKYEGYTLAEAANILGIGAKAAEMRWARAKERLT